MLNWLTRRNGGTATPARFSPWHCFGYCAPVLLLCMAIGISGCGGGGGGGLGGSGGGGGGLVKFGIVIVNPGPTITTPSGTFTGGSPVPGAVVQLRSGATVVMSETTALTTLNGKSAALANFPGLATGTYEIYVNLNGGSGFQDSGQLILTNTDNTSPQTNFQPVVGQTNSFGQTTSNTCVVGGGGDVNIQGIVYLNNPPTGAIAACTASNPLTSEVSIRVVNLNTGAIVQQFDKPDQTTLPLSQQGTFTICQLPAPIGGQQPIPYQIEVRQSANVSAQFTGNGPSFPVPPTNYTGAQTITICADSGNVAPPGAPTPTPTPTPTVTPTPSPTPAS